MTPSPEYLARLRMAIALDQGWKFDPSCGPLSLHWRKPDMPAWDGENWSGRASEVPDYCNSRDAIVGAILRRFKTPGEMHLFMVYLNSQLRTEAICATNFALTTATALQLAVAYSKAANLNIPTD